MADIPARSGWKIWTVGLLSAALAAVSALSLGAGSQTPFSDVDETHPRHSDIAYAAAQGWFQGYPDGAFQPDRPITPEQTARIIERAQPGLTRSGAAVLLRAGVHALQTSGIQVTDTTLAPPPEPGLGNPAEEAFSDVDRTHPQYEDIAYAAEHGWFQGYPDGAFRPDRSITSVQTARIIERAQPELTRSEAAVLLRAGVQALQTSGILVTDTTQAPPPEPAAERAAGQAETTTTAAAAATTTRVFLSGPPRVRHPTWDNRLPSTWRGLPDTACHDTFRYSADDPPQWNYWYLLTGYHIALPHESAVIAAALGNPSYEPAAGTPKHTALANLGLTSAQDIRGIGEGAADVRWYARLVKDWITGVGDPSHPDCASILAGADAVLNAPLPTTATMSAGS